MTLKNCFAYEDQTIPHDGTAGGMIRAYYTAPPRARGTMIVHARREIAAHLQFNPANSKWLGCEVSFHD